MKFKQILNIHHSKSNALYQIRKIIQKVATVQDEPENVMSDIELLQFFEEKIRSFKGFDD